MKLRGALNSGIAAVALAASLAASGATAAATKHHPARKAPPAPDSSALLQGQIGELQAQVRELKAWRDSQAAAQAQADAEMNQLKQQLSDAQNQQRAAQARLDEQIETRMGRILTLIEPLMLVFMGIIVSMILVAIYLPLVSALGQSQY